MKKLLVVITGLAMAVALCACDGDAGKKDDPDANSSFLAETGKELVLYTTAPETYEGLPTITPESLKAKLDNGERVVIVDVNPDSYYNVAHLPGAVHYKWALKGFAEDPGLSKGVPIVFYCDCDVEEDSGHMGFSLARDWGYRNVMLLKGGRVAWIDAGFPTEAKEDD